MIVGLTMLVVMMETMAMGTGVLIPISELQWHTTSKLTNVIMMLVVGVT